MNIKKGDVLKMKNNNEYNVTILSIIDDLYFTSRICDKTEGCTFFTLEGLKETFELPEEKWMPEELQTVYFIDLVDFIIRPMIWRNSESQIGELEQGLIKQTKKAAEAKLAEVLKLLQA